MRKKKIGKCLPRKHKKSSDEEIQDPEVDPIEAALNVQRSVDEEFQRVAGPDGKVQAPPELLRFIAVRPEFHPQKLPLTFW